MVARLSSAIVSGIRSRDCTECNLWRDRLSRLSTLFTTARRRISTFSEISARQGLRNKQFGTHQIRL